MNDLVLAHGEQVTWSTFGTDWLYLGVPVAVLIGVVSWLIATGEARPGVGLLGRLFLRAGSSLERVTGLPAWSSGAIAMGLWALVVAVIGFLWDVAWHMDLGRDQFLFTPSHMMILIGLASIAAASVLAVVFATLGKADAGIKIRRLRIPYAALPLGALGFGALMGFPLDELWHRNYGVDVTMWGPTHLVMISGASFSTLALWLFLAEPGPDVAKPWVYRVLRHTFAGAAILGLSTFQAEFDFGTPQFQQLYHPVLIAIAAAMGLTIARVVLGRGGALIAAAGFIATRGLLALLLGEVLNHTVARFPLYVGAALVVELAAWLARERGPLAFAVMAGALAGTVGVAAEWGWMQVWGRHPWNTNLFPAMAIVPLIAIAAAVIGTAMGRVLAHRNAGMPLGHLAIAGLVLISGLTVPLPRHDSSQRATVTTTPAGDGRVNIAVDVEPASAVERTDWFNVLSWQGGYVQLTELESIGSGRYEATKPVPASGDWKTFVRIADKDVMVAVPVYMPADPEIGADEIPLRPTRTAGFVRDTQLLMREAHAGAAWPALVAYGCILALALGWIASFAFAFTRIGDTGRPLGARRPARRTPRAVDRSDRVKQLVP